MIYYWENKNDPKNFHKIKVLERGEDIIKFRTLDCDTKKLIGQEDKMGLRTLNDFYEPVGGYCNQKQKLNV